MPKFIRTLTAVLASLGLVLASVLLTAAPANAAVATVSISPLSTTVESNTNVTYTISITCSGAGGCVNTVVTFPTDAITGNGANNDISSWFIGNSTCGFVTKSVGGGVVSYDYGDLPTGTQNCNITVRAPEYTTLGGAVATLIPTVSGDTFDTFTGTGATLELIAGHNSFLAKSSPVNVLPGAEFSFNVRFVCGENAEYTGDIGMSYIRIEDPLPANFVYSHYSTSNGVPASVTITEPAVGSTGGTFVYEDSTGATCGNPPLNAGNAMTISLFGTIDGPVGTQSCNTATAEGIYIDAVEDSWTSQTACTTVIDIATIASKGAVTTSLGNVGQYTFPGGNLPYTHPGDWDQTGAPVTFNLAVRTNPVTPNAGVAYLLRDPMPCLDNLVSGIYQPRAIGDLCQNPAFIPGRITATGFTPSAANEIILHLTDGTTVNVPFASGGWDIAGATADGTVAELEIPAFPEEGANTGTITFAVGGRVAESALPGNVVRNTLSSEPYLVGQVDPLREPQLSTANVGIVGSDNGPGGDGETVVYPNIVAQAIAGQVCQIAVNLRSNSTASQRNMIEITSTPSEAIYLDYLAPVGGTITNGTTKTFQLSLDSDATRIFTATGVAAIVTEDFNGTGRTLYSWVIPAGVITIPGVYRINTTAMTVDLGAGCAGTYENDITVGYGAAVTSCVFNPNFSPFAQTPPMLPNRNDDLDTNGSPIEDNFCGFSRAVSFAVQNEGYSLTKTVQGNLDPVPGASGRVSPEGGEATYVVSFSNSGGATLNDPVMYDILPAVGDTTSLGTPRGSDFTVELISMGAIPAGVVVEYSTAGNPCRPEVLATNPGCVDDWSTTPPADLGDTTALRISYEGPVYVQAAPGFHGFEISYTVSTPPTDPGDVALNSVGTSVYAGDELMPPAESQNVGIEAADDPLLVTKEASISSFDAAGTTIDYTFTVTNGSGVTLTGVTLTDAFTDAAPGSSAPTPTCVELTNPDAACSGTSVTLLDGQVASFSASYVTTQDDLEHGGITDVATATGTPPTGGPLVGESNGVEVTADQNPSLTLTKVADPTTVDAEGEAIAYTFTVTNTGNVSLTAVSITETVFTGTGTAPTITCPTDPLPPGDDFDCSGSYVVTQADIDAGVIENTATASASGPSGPAVTSAPSSATVTANRVAALELLKTATPDEVSAVGEVVDYSFEVTNTGNVTISTVSITEVDFSGDGEMSAIDCPTIDLLPDDTLTCTATYAVQQADLDAGSITNSATASGVAPDGVTAPISAASDFTVSVEVLPGIDLEKSGTLSASEADATITYEFEITNTGNVALTDVVVTDDMVGLSAIAITWPGAEGVLPADGSVTGIATYTVTQEDVDNGSVLNEATVTGTPPSGEDVSDTDDETVTFVQNPLLDLTKTGELTGAIDVGEEVAFDFTIENVGNVTVTDVDIDDELVGISSITFGAWPGAVGVLEPGDVVTASATYELTADDLENGNVVNTATATGTAPGGDPSNETTITVALEIDPGIVLIKTGELDSDEPPVEGDTITYTFTIENTGNVPLTGVEVTDELAGLSAVDYDWPDPTQEGRLGAGVTMTATATYTLTQEDIDLGDVVNTATATGDAPGGETPSSTSGIQVDLDADPALTLVKTSDFESERPEAGDQVVFDFVVSNTGNVTIDDVDIADVLPGISDIEFGTWPGDAGSLAPGDEVTATATYVLEQGDIDLGELVNEASASGTAIRGGVVLTGDEVTLELAQMPELELVKTADRDRAGAGDVIAFTIVAANTGNVTLTEVLVEDELAGLSPLEFEWPDAEGVLAPGDEVTVTATYTVEQGDVSAGEVVNTAVATATGPGDEAVSATDAVTITIVPPLALTGAQGAALILSVALALLGAGAAVVLLTARRRAAA